MKSSLPLKLLAAATLLSLSAYSLSAAIIVEDNFDSYSTGTLTNDAFWPTAVPGVSPPASWYARGEGTQSIVAAPSRSGNAYEFTETANGEFPQSYLGLPSAYAGTDVWAASFDFRIAALTNTASYGLFKISDGASDSLVQLRAFASGSDYYVYAVLSDTGKGSALTYPNVGTLLSLDQWYTATITGNNTSGAVTVQIAGFSQSSGFYTSNTSQFDRLEIGDQNSGATATSSIYMDNLSVTSVPEPSTFATLLVTGACFGLVRRRRA